MNMPGSTVIVNKVTLEDMEIGVGTVMQTRGGQQVQRTRINAKNFPYDETHTLSQRLDQVSQDLAKVEGHFNRITTIKNEVEKIIATATEKATAVTQVKSSVEAILEQVKIEHAEVSKGINKANETAASIGDLLSQARANSVTATEAVTNAAKILNAVENLKDETAALAEKTECAMGKIKTIVTTAKQEFTEQKNKIQAEFAEQSTNMLAKQAELDNKVADATAKFDEYTTQLAAIDAAYQIMKSIDDTYKALSDDTLGKLGEMQELYRAFTDEKAALETLKNEIVILREGFISFVADKLIDDTQPSSVMTYSSAKLEAKFEEFTAAIRKLETVIMQAAEKGGLKLSEGEWVFVPKDRTLPLPARPEPSIPAVPTTEFGDGVDI